MGAAKETASFTGYGSQKRLSFRLKLLLEGRFPQLWTPDREQRDLRQLVLHRHKLVEIRSRVKNGLQPLSLNKGMQRKAKLWSEAGQKLLRELPLKPWAACQREDLLGLLATLNQQIGKLDEAVQQAAEQNPQARLLMTPPQPELPARRSGIPPMDFFDQSC